MSYVVDENPWDKNSTSYDVWGRPKTYTDKTLFHSTFFYSISRRLWRIHEGGTYLTFADTSSNTGIGTGQALVNAGGSLNDFTFIRSKRSPKYMPNRGHLFSTALALPSKTSSGERNFGFISMTTSGAIENGAFFRLKTDGKLYACIYSDGTQIKEEEITLPSGFDVENGNIYDISMQWRGAGDYFFHVGDPNDYTLKIVHSIRFLNTQEAPTILNPAFPATFYSKNLGDNVQIRLNCVDITSEGGDFENRTFKTITNGRNGTALSSNGQEPIMLVRLNDTFNGEVATRDAVLERITASCNNQWELTVYATDHAALFTGTTGWASVFNEDNIEYSIGDDISVSSFSAPTLLPIYLTRVQQDVPFQIINPTKNDDFYASPGDYLLVTAEASNGNDVWITAEFYEEI